MLISIKNWSLMVNFNNVVADYVKPDRKATASIFSIANEKVIFTGSEKMSPFNFDSFQFVVTSVKDAESFRIGISIMYI